MVLKKLTEVVNVVPVIAKSDSMTLDERALFKQRVCQAFSSELLTATDIMLDLGRDASQSNQDVSI